MPETPNILERGFKNVSQNGKAVGFQLMVKTSYYRGVALSLIEDFAVTVDGETFKRDQIRFGLKDKTYTLDEMADVTNVRWPWQEPATLTILKPGGLKPGLHDIQVVQKDRISYMPTNPQVRTYKKKLPLLQ